MRNFIMGFPVLLGLLLGNTALAQEDKDSTKSQLAVQYYQEEEYEKARPLLEKLYKEDENSSYYYEYYLNTLVKPEDYKAAEKLLKSRIRSADNKLKFEVVLGHIYDLQDNTKKAEKTWDQVLEDLEPNENRIQIVANSFQNRGETGYAIKTYQEGRELMNDEQAFSLQLARLHRREENYEKSFPEYVQVVLQDRESRENIQDELQELVMEPEPYDAFKNVLLQEIRNHPEQHILIDLLSWLYTQNEDFSQAFRQLKALQKRLDTDGKRLMDLAEVARKNEDYETAEDVYEHIVSLGPDNRYHFKARQGKLDVQYDRITKLGNYNQETLTDLENAYEDFIGKNRFRYEEHGKSILRLAEIKAVYLDKVDSAIAMLENLIENEIQRNRTLLAEAKLALGDYYVLNDNVWDATLYYSQVEKMFKGNDLGQEAKFRNAKLSFYKGEFDWAVSQLDVLKGATSELIANDALKLSMLIKDNRGLDTTEVPMMMYARADFHIFKNNFDNANVVLDSLLSRFPDHNLIDEVYLAKAEMAEQQGNFEEAMTHYEKVHKDFSDDILADEALYQAARLAEQRLDNTEKAKALYETIILDHKGSVFREKARNHYRRLRGDKVN